ncbi:riboflavin synthase [Helcobacillus massiliensis]|uniref:Riboflavin synthase n=1 Tax=Helcobacillus massiliensis TaxID=521392 RepID=A0A839QQ02_9MICO|nr:riboflavin synthase [Helcobacillus massiliensis]MBB3022072.1 riboflavin synthase alpha subunit [Helcobacillus massiliensis]
MFTGIVEAKGRIVEIRDFGGSLTRLTVSAPADLIADLQHGASIAVSGVCLTALAEPAPEHAPGESAATTDAADPGAAATALFTADVMGETLALTTLGGARVGDEVNLERCTRAGDRLDGHIVQGHVDAVGTVVDRRDEGQWRRLRVQIPSALAGQIAQKGSIALDGVSLTITEVSVPGAAEPFAEVALIPETLRATTLGRASVGTRVNVETDAIAKYTQRLLAVAAARPAPASACDRSTAAPADAPKEARA